MANPIEQIKDKLSIVDVVGSYVELKHAGKHFKAKSPFTNEKTPSFYVSPDRGVYYCFSSQKGGDMFTFVQEMEGVDFKGALKILADRAGVELVPEDPGKRDERETQYALLEAAATYFVHEREKHPHIDEYITNRGVKTSTAISWRIGYAKDEWRALKAHLTEKGFSETEMLRAGLIKRADGGKEPYDVFRDRIMFPIMDASGRVVAFSGRTMKTEPGIPKYVNSPETELYQKSEILYGYDKARHGIRQYQCSLIVEGQFDLVLCHQAGYTNTVAVSGTALTPHHIQLLLRLSHNVILALDADRAGISAMKRSALPMLLHGMDVKVARFPNGQDPADVVRTNPQDLKRIVGSSVHIVEFLLGILSETTHNDERTYKLRVREEVLPIVAAIDNRIDREHFEGIVAERIGATKDGVHFEVERIIENNAKEAAPKLKPTATKEFVGSELTAQMPASRRVKLEQHLAALMHLAIGERAWIAPHITKHLTEIHGEGAHTLGALSPQAAGELFRLEEELQEVKEKQFLEMVSETLTNYAHAVARDTLMQLRSKLKEVEGEGKHDEALILLAETKRAEQLLQSVIVLEKGQ